MDGIFRSAKNRGKRIKTLVNYVKTSKMETGRSIINCKLRGRTLYPKKSRGDDRAGVKIE